MAIGKERTVSAPLRARVKYEPRAEIEPIANRGQVNLSTARIAHAARSRIAGTLVDRYSHTVDGCLKVPGLIDVDVFVQIRFFQERQNTSMHSPGAIVTGFGDPQV